MPVNCSSEGTTANMLKQYLEKIGLNDKEQAIYITLAGIGIQPASVIARKCKLDRVTTYKNLKKMADQGFVKIYSENGIQCFGIESFDNLNHFLKEKLNSYSELVQEFPIAENLLKSLKAESSLVPKLQIFEGETGIKNLFKDLLFELKSEGIRQVRIITSNTFEERLGDVPLSRFVHEFYDEIKKRKIDTQIFEAAGNLIPEHLNSVSIEKFDPTKLPAAQGTTNIFLAGHALYIACYKDTQIGLKVKQTEMSQIFHFLFDFIAKKI